MPKLIFMTEDLKALAKQIKIPINPNIQVKGAVFIECELIPEGDQEVEIAEKVSATYCRPKCGYYRDATIRKLQLFCFNPKSPYLAQLKKELERFGLKRGL